MRSNVEKQVATTEQNPVDLNLGQRDLTCSHHRPPLSPWKLPQYQQLHALPILSPCPISFLWGQGLPGLLVPKHRPASTLRHQNIWSPPVGPPVTVRGLLQPQAPARLPLLTAILPHCGEHICPLFRRPELVTSQLWGRGSWCYPSWASVSSRCGGRVGLKNSQSPVSPDLPHCLI